MDFSFLGQDIENSLNTLNLNELNEIRIRLNYPIKYICKNKTDYLYNKIKRDKIICNKNLIEKIILNLTENSIYAFNDRIKEGYITTNDGIRVGIVGTCVFKDDKLITLKDITSLNIRIPHFIYGCSDKILPYVICDNVIKNTLIVSPPKMGKTTLLKDLILNLNKLNKNVLIIDERGEFNKVNGENIDKIMYTKKQFSILNAIRSMAPDVIVTDELVNNEDFLSAKYCSDSGVKIISSCHADTIDNLRNKNFFIKGIFERYFILNSNGNFGKIDLILDGDFNKI